jgi:preprotein translocase subunit SecG
MSTIRREKKLLLLFCGLFFLLTIVLSLVTSKANAQR